MVRPSSHKLAGQAARNPATEDTRRVELGFIAATYYLLGDFQGALSYCESSGEEDLDAQACLAGTHDKLGRQSDAEAMLTKMRARVGD